MKTFIAIALLATFVGQIAASVSEPQCGANEEYSHCVNGCPAPLTCEQVVSGEVPECSDEHCEEGCRCLEGYARNSYGECVHQNQCCEDSNAEVVSCPNRCPGGTCESPAFAPCRIACPIRGCQCKKGCVKGNNGKCIQQSKCPKPKPTQKPKCSAYEEWSSVCPDCPEQCDNIGKPRCKTTKPGCACVSGYVREKKGGKCIKKSSCKKY